MAPSDPVRAVPWRYLGGDVVTSPQNGVNSIFVNSMPTDCTIISFRPNGGDVYYDLNGDGSGADTNSPGFVADGGGEVIGPISNLGRLDVYTTGGSPVHLMFYKEQKLFR